jgi:hypothetical protein
MAGSRQPLKGEQPALQSVRRGWLGGWRVSALVIGAVAIGLIYVGKFGLPDLLPAPASPSPSATSGSQASPTPTPTATGDPSGQSTTDPSGPTAAPSASATPTPIRPHGRPTRPPADRYTDGIPTRIGAEPVVRVSDVVNGATPGDDGLLVGGWYADGRLIEELGRPTDRATSLAVGELDLAEGPVVLRINPGPGGPTVSELVWTGDPQTDATPISVAPLLSQLQATYSSRSLVGVDRVDLELASVELDCRPAWPRHTYIPRSGPVRLVLAFSTPTDRLIAESDITQSIAWFNGQSNPGCASPQVRIGGRMRWLVDGNVMLLIRSTTENTRLARQALGAARQQSDQLEPLWRPVTTWQAFRALWQVVPDLDVAPAAEEVACVLDFPVETWALRHPQLRALAVFESRDARLEFQALTDATTVRLERGGCTSLGGQRPIDADARWVGAENILLLVTGPPDLDPLVLAAIPRSRIPYR